ncbi:MAG TPA: peptidylprolyl isomerase [Planctomycetota bacterium]|nr:peptidylprolyl isomerase [Planctomycetota bacterium]
MSRTFAASFLLSLGLLGPADRAGAQTVLPGLNATMRAERELVPSGHDVRVLLILEASKDVDLPGDLLTGLVLDTKVDDKPGTRINEPGKGGAVALRAGTRIERTLTVPIGRLLPAGGSSSDFARITLSWPDLPGANCMVKVAPDCGKLNVDDLDLAKTKVVLVTGAGDMTLVFLADKAPGTVKNFVKLAMSGFYDGTRFHRTIRNFMIQGGDPNTKDESKKDSWGQGNPGYTIKGEVNGTKHVRGVLSMANSGSPDTAGSQFFICHRDASHLDAGYTAFGNLEKGADVLDAIATAPVGGPQGDAPVNPVMLYYALVLPVKK